MEKNGKFFPPAPSLELSLIITVYNEEKTMEELINRCDSVLSSKHGDYEIIVVDDGSFDRTVEITRAKLVSITGLRIVQLYRNVGQVAAISAGLSVARGRWLMLMDGDLQHQPEDIPRFLSLRAEGYDLIASYRRRREETLRRRLLTPIINFANRAALGVQIADFGSAFRLFRAEIANMMKDKQGYVHYNTPELFINARRYTEIPIEQVRRKAGSSKWTFLAFMLFNFDFLVTAMRPVLIAVWGSIIGVFIGMLLYILYLSGAISDVEALSGPVSIVLISILIFMLAVVWREIVRNRNLLMGVPPFLIENIYSRELEHSGPGSFLSICPTRKEDSAKE